MLVAANFVTLHVRCGDDFQHNKHNSKVVRDRSIERYHLPRALGTAARIENDTNIRMLDAREDELESDVCRCCSCIVCSKTAHYCP